MSVNTHHHIPPRTRQLIVDQYLAQNDNPSTKSVLSQTYGVSTSSINKYIKRYIETGTVLSEYELNQKYGKKTERETQNI